MSTGHQRRRWTVRLGWGVMGAGVALTLGGNAVVCLLAFLAACAIDRTKRLMPQHRIPSVYLQAAGGFLATVIAVAASATGLELNPSRVVTAGIVMLLAGMGLLGATQDAIPGSRSPPAPACRRRDGHRRHHRRRRCGPHVGRPARGGGRHLQPGAAGLARRGDRVRRRPRRSGFAFSSYAPLRALVAVALVGRARAGRPARRRQAEVGRAWGPAVAAVTIGAVCYLVAGRFRVPPLVVVVPAIVPSCRDSKSTEGLALLAPGRTAYSAGLRARDRFRTRGRGDPRPVHRPAAQAGGPSNGDPAPGPRMVGPLRRPGAKGKKH